MDQNHVELVRVELRNARERLKAAELLAGSGLIPDAVSRAYYCAFHAARAALARHGLNPESHSGLRMLLGVHLIEQGLLPRRLGKILAELSERRESADYDSWMPLDPEDATEAVRVAREFLAGIEAFLRESGLEV